MEVMAWRNEVKVVAVATFLAWSKLGARAVVAVPFADVSCRCALLLCLVAVPCCSAELHGTPSPFLPPSFCRSLRV